MTEPRSRTRMAALCAAFLNDVMEEFDRARELFPSNRHMLGAMHEEVGEVAKAFLERDYKAIPGSSNILLDKDAYTECVQAAAMVMRVAIEGDPDYKYENPNYRDMDDEQHIR